MTPLLLSPHLVINLEQITWVEETSWHKEGRPDYPIITGLVVHFVGGSTMRLVDAAADEARQQLLFSVAA